MRIDSLGLEAPLETPPSRPSRCGHPRARGSALGRLASEDSEHPGPAGPRMRREPGRPGRPQAAGVPAGTWRPGTETAPGRAGRVSRREPHLPPRGGGSQVAPARPPSRAPSRKWPRRGPGAASAGRASSAAPGGAAGPGGSRSPSPNPSAGSEPQWPPPRLRWTSCPGTSRTGRWAPATAPCRARGTAGTR